MIKEIFVIPKRHWDIFCKVVDNFGDIGVCWRLAKQLAHEHGLQVRLFVDDLSTTQKIIPSLQILKKIQSVDGVNIMHWQADMRFEQAADVAIEVFVCGLPEAYLGRMPADTVWVNLEYLSAEPWVADFHAKASIRGQLTRHFYFPGFTENTGGLLREHDLIVRRDKFLSSQIQNKDLKISLFCYENAPLQALFHTLAGGTKQVTIFAPFTNSIQQIAVFFGKESLKVGDEFTKGQLTLQVLPFLSQADYDKLLWTCNINFVRGEDSWIRAIWAGKPFIWQPYPQTEETHIKKLNAFLELFYSENESACEAHSAWSSGLWSSEIWQRYLDDLTATQATTQMKSNQLIEQTDLAAKLVDFCINA